MWTLSPILSVFLFTPWSTQVFNFEEVEFVFPLVTCALVVTCQKPLPNPKLWRLRSKVLHYNIGSCVQVLMNSDACAYFFICVGFILDQKFIQFLWKLREIWQIYYFTCLCAMSLQLYPTLCSPMNFSLPGSSVHEILQARILEWVAIPFCRGSSQPRDQTLVFLGLLLWQASSLPLAPPGKSIYQNDGLPKPLCEYLRMDVSLLSIDRCSLWWKVLIVLTDSLQVLERPVENSRERIPFSLTAQHCLDPQWESQNRRHVLPSGVW